MYTTDKPLGRHLIIESLGSGYAAEAFKPWLYLKQKPVISLPCFVRQKAIFDDHSSPFLFFIKNYVIKKTEKKKKETRLTD